MNLFGIFKREATVSDEAIMEAAGPWIRYCAVSAINGTLGGDLSLSVWLDCCERTWIKKVSKDLGVSVARIRSATDMFAYENSHREAELEAELSGVLLKPGQTMEIKIQLQMSPKGKP